MRRRHVAPAVLLLSLAFAGTAFAQQDEGKLPPDPGRIPNNIIVKDRSLDDDEQKLVAKVVEACYLWMASGKADYVARGRDRLIEPYNQAPKDSFLAFYNQIVATKLTPVADSEHQIARINVQIVASKVKNVKIVDVIKRGLKDDSSAVVYLAAQSIASIMADSNTPDVLRLQMVKPLIAAIQKENSGWVLEYLYQALIDTNEWPGIDAALKKLVVRAAVHAERLDGMLAPEITAVRIATNKLARLKFEGKDIPNETRVLCGQALFLLADHCTNVLSLKQVTGTPETSYQSLLAECDTGFDSLVKNLMEKSPPPRLRGKDIKDQRLVVLDNWRRILKEDLKLTDAQLALPKPAPKPEPEKAPIKAPAEVPASGG